MESLQHSQSEPAGPSDFVEKKSQSSLPSQGYPVLRLQAKRRAVSNPAPKGLTTAEKVTEAIHSFPLCATTYNRSRGVQRRRQHFKEKRHHGKARNLGDVEGNSGQG